MKQSRLRAALAVFIALTVTTGGIPAAVGAALPAHPAQQNTTNETVPSDGDGTTTVTAFENGTGDEEPVVTGEDDTDNDTDGEADTGTDTDADADNTTEAEADPPTDTTIPVTNVDGVEGNATPKENASDDGTPGQQTVNPTEVEERGLEPNDEWKNATGAAVGQTILETLGNEDLDWYVYQLDEGGTVEVSLTAGSRTNMSTFVYRGGELADRSYVTPGESVTLSATHTGQETYYLLVRDESGSDGVSSRYAFNLRHIRSADDPLIGDDDTTESDESGGGGIPLTPLYSLIILIAGLILVFRRTNSGTGDDDTDEVSGIGDGGRF